MVRRYFRAKDRDASPFLGISECDASDSDRSASAKDTMRRETRLYYSSVPVPPLPSCEMRVLVRVQAGSAPASRPLTQRSQASSVISASSVFSPLVVGLPQTSAASAQSFSVTVEQSDATVEDLARLIERTHAPLTCTALFRGRTPLLFGQRVRQVLRPNDTVTVYTGHDDASSRSSTSSDGAVIEYARHAGSACVLLPLPDHDVRASAVSIGRVDMARVFAVVARAPLKARFINVLVTPQLLRAFMSFCALPSELALESLLFVLDVERFRHVQPSVARLLANYIYLSYVAPGAPLRINVSAMMRGRIPWPFLPGWEYNPWVFDEILASVGFMLKKHTLLRFEGSPVGLVQTLDAVAEQYVQPLRLDDGVDPMAAIAESYEPDIDVVVWVNELRFDGDGASAHLAQLGDDFREQLLERVCSQFVDAPSASALCDGYFQLATRIAPLQKQRKIKKTRKLRNFFGDNPHEALLRQQLMAVVPPSSHRGAARAAAELVARKRTAEHRLRACDELNRQGSLSSSLIAEQKIMDSDGSDDEPEAGWAHYAMQQCAAPAAVERVRSWSDSSNDEAAEESAQALRRNNGWTTDEDEPEAAEPRGRSGVYGDRALSRALSMIGVPNPDSQDSTSSDGNASPRAGDPAHLPSFSVYTAPTYSSQSLGRKFKFFERKRRADKLREFFGSTDQPRPPSLEELSSASSSIPSLSWRSASFMRNDAPLTPEQRNVLVRRRRKLKALLGEQVDECVVSLANDHFSLDALDNSSYSLLTPEHTSLSSELANAPDSAPPGDVHAAQIRQYSKIRDMLGDNAPPPLISDPPASSVKASDEQRVRARWRRNKLVNMLGDVPADVSTLYRTDTRSQDTSETDEPAPPSESKYERRQRVKKLRHFFGQSLNSDAMLMQGIAREPNGRMTPASDIDECNEIADCDSESFELVGSPAPTPAPTLAPAVLPALDDDALGPVKAQFWMTSSPESQAAELPENRRSSLMTTLRAHKASIIGSIKRGSPQLGSRSRASTQSSHASLASGPATPQLAASSISAPSLSSSPALPPPSPGKLSFLARKIGRPSPKPSPLVPPARLSSIKPLSPLPDISPNNLQASFDRSMAQRDTTLVSELHPPAKYPPRISSAMDRGDHRQLISSVLLSSTGPISTRSRPSPAPSPVSVPAQPRRSASKSVHWFDQLSPPPPPAPSTTASAKSSMEMGMAIVLRSPSIKKPSIKSPMLSPRTAARSPPPRSRFPALPINSPTSGARVPLSHKASVSAVGGKQLLGGQSEPRRPPITWPEPVNHSIVTIRARRTRSFAIQRKLELATVGRKRAHTIGTGRQAESRPVNKDKQDTDAGIPQADKSSRRAQSMILSPDPSSTENKVVRGRCATVIPLHLELQRMLARRIASRRQTRALELATIKEAEEPPRNREQSLRMTADALCAQKTRLRTSLALFGTQDPSRLRRGSCQLSTRTLRFTPTAVKGVPLPYKPQRPRSMSCPGKFIANPRKRTPIQPAVARYLQSANAGYSRRAPIPSTYGSGSYQRISIALLSRPPNGRRSLDTRPTHRKLSPYM
ncbi:hypothetical protein IWW55_002687, partial [Coemansia sp. RSA 2706]